MEIGEEVRLLIEKHIVTGCEQFQLGMRALLNNNLLAYASQLQNAATVGLGALEQLPKIYLNGYCRARLTAQDCAVLDGTRTTFPELARMLGRYAQPRLEPAQIEQLIRDKRLRNDAEHSRSTPPPPALRQALERLVQLVILYLPVDGEQRAQLDAALRKLENSGPGRQLSVEEARRLFGAAVRVVDPGNFSPATEAEIHQFYEGTPLSWKIILANGDVERSQRTNLLAQYAQPGSSTRMLCLTGEPGSGKSTLAWRLALNIADAAGQTLLHLRDNRAADFWINLEPGAQEWGSPLVVLVDDVFRGPEAVRTLRTLSTDLPVTIIATARSNEFPQHISFPFAFQRERLQRPTDEEKTHVSERFEDAGIAVQGDRRERLLHAGSWWEMMFEATAGKQSRMVVEDTLVRLQEADPVVYRAMELLCFLGQFDLALPVALLEALDGDFYRLLVRPSTDGLIFYANDAQDALRAPHANWSALAAAHFNSNPYRLAERLLAAARPNAAGDQAFVVDWLLRMLQNRQQPVVEEILARNAAQIDALVEAAGVQRLLESWAVLFERVQQPEQAKRCEALALARPPASDDDWQALLRLHQRRPALEGEQAVLDGCLDWILAHPASRALLLAYVAYLERRAQPELTARLLRDLARVVASAPEDLGLRSVQTRVINRYGRREHKREQARDLLAMLRADRQRWASISPYWNFLTRNLTKDERSALIEDAITLLEQEPDHAALLLTVFPFIYRDGSAAQQARFFPLVEGWLAEHPDEPHLRAMYARTQVERAAPPERPAQIHALAGWLDGHPDDLFVRQTFLTILREFGERDQKRAYLPVIETWLDEHPAQAELYAQYTTLVCQCGTYPQKRDWIDKFGDWLPQYPGNFAAQLSMLTLLHEAGDSAQCQQYIDGALRAQKRPTDKDTSFEALLGFTMRRGSETQKQRILRLVEDALARDQQGNTNLQAKYLHEILRHGDLPQRLHAIGMAARWVEADRASMNLWDLYLSLVASTEQPEQIAAVMQQAGAALREKAWDHNLRAKLLSMVERYGSPAEVALWIDETHRWLEGNIDNTNVRQPYLGLVTKHGSDEQVLAAVNATAEWLVQHASDDNILARYLFLVARRDVQPELERAATFAKIWFTDHPDRTRPNLMGNYAYVLYRLERCAEANPWFERALSARNNHLFFLRTVYAWSLYAVGAKQAAHAQLYHLLRVPEHFPLKTTYIHLGRFALLEGQHAQAINHFSRAVAAGPDDPHPLVELAQGLLAAGKPKGAIRQLISARALLPDGEAALRAQIETLLQQAVTEAKRLGM